jgi:hypothetical protein
MMAVELPREEVALLFGTLTACGFLILGVLEIMWPAARRSSPARPVTSRSLASRAVAPASPRAAAAAPVTAAAQRPARIALASRPAAMAQPLPTPPPVTTPVATAPSPSKPLSALEVARLLLDRAASERDLERRVTILNRAVAGLTRSAQAAPEDEALSQMLISTRALLWETWERIAKARLAAAMPWSGEILAAEVTPVLARTR